MRFALSLHYNRANSFLFVNVTDIYKIKAKDCGMLNWYIYDFSVDYDAIAVDDILDTQTYLMKKNNII